MIAKLGVRNSGIVGEGLVVAVGVGEGLVVAIGVGKDVGEGLGDGSKALASTVLVFVLKLISDAPTPISVTDIVWVWGVTVHLLVPAGTAVACWYVPSAYFNAI